MLMQNSNTKFDVDSCVASHVKQMHAYSSARLEFDGKDAIFLDANENSLGSVTASLHNRYPDPLQTEVKQQLAQIEAILPSQLFIGNGSDECIDVLVRCFCEAGKDKILHCPPVFSMYEHVAHIQNLDIIEVLLLPEIFQLDTVAILKEIKENDNLKIIFICSPNNPTDNLINEADIITVLQQFKGLVVIDEAYHDFSITPSWIKQLNNYPNLVVIKTFSKAWGLADARIGMLYANERVIQYMNVIKMPYNVNQYSQKLAEEALKNYQQKNIFVEELNNGKQYIVSELQQLPVVKTIFPTDANFVLFRVDDADAVYQHLVKNNIIVRNRNKAPLLKGCLRVSVGTKEENNQFITVMKELV